MALNTNNSGSVSVFAKAPTVPENLGKVDIGGIYDAVTSALRVGDQVGTDVGRIASTNDQARTALAESQAKRTVLPAETGAKIAEAGAATSLANKNKRINDFLGTVNPNSAILAGFGQIPQNKRVSRRYDPATQSVITTEESSTPAAGGAPATPTGSTTSSEFAPRVIETVASSTDARGNLIINKAKWIPIDASKPAFHQDPKTGQLTPLLGEDGQPVNAQLVGSDGSAARGTPLYGSAANFAAALATAEQEWGADDPRVIQMRNALGPILNAAGSIAPKNPNAPKVAPLNEYQQNEKTIDDDKTRLADATLQGDTALVDALKGSIQRLQTRQDAINTGTAHAKTDILGGLATAPSAPGTVTPAATGAGAEGKTGATQETAKPVADRAAYDALQPGTWYVDPNGAVGRKK